MSRCAVCSSRSEFLVGAMQVTTMQEQVVMFQAQAKKLPKVCTGTSVSMCSFTRGTSASWQILTEI